MNRPTEIQEEEEEEKNLDEKSAQQLQVLRAVEEALTTRASTSTLEIADSLSLQHEKLVGIVRALESRKKLSLSDAKEKVVWCLTEEGKCYAKGGTPEARLFQLVKGASKAVLISDLKSSGIVDASLLDIGLKNALRLKWIGMDKGVDGGSSSSGGGLVCCVDAVVDEVQTILKSIGVTEQMEEEVLLKCLGEKGNAGQLQELKKRKLVDVKRTKYYGITKGVEFSIALRKLATDLTQEMIINETWKDLEFKPYNFFAAGVKPQRGSMHPLMRVMTKFKKVLLSMNFEEMPTKNWVENSFWNFDALFQPQQHPARDVQDTFFLKNPSSSTLELLPQDYLQQVKRMHEKGGEGSIGWRYEWSTMEAQKNILRTHTTATSSRMLYKLAQEYKKTGVFVPKRYFSIDRVFRNETLDATHLAEFHQVEGLVCEEGMTLADLMGMMDTFYKKVGLSALRFKPTYNPYTEPSMEIYGFHPSLNKWIEVGNSGVFRPEMLLPMGFPSRVSVIAWGLSLERPTMIRYGIRNIRELFGHRATLGVV